MRNIPFFTTELGVASLIFEQMWFNRSAYIRVQSSENAAQFIDECASFCKAVGAERIYVAGEKIPHEYPLSGTVIRMRRQREGLDAKNALLVPLSSDNMEDFRKSYNCGMAHIPNASGLTIQAVKDFMSNGNAYFVTLENEVIGIGIVENEWIRGIVSLQRGMGELVLASLTKAVKGDEVCVEVIDSNIPAIRLYERMGFCIYEVVSQWYEIKSEMSRRNT